MGDRWLLQDLKGALCDDRLTEFKLVVAYTKSGPLYRLQELLDAWRSAGKSIEANFGINQQGTSKETLELSLSLFDVVYITQGPGITFHPKVYLITGPECTQAIGPGKPVNLMG